MDPEDFEVDTAIGLPTTACWAVATIEIRLHSAMYPGGQPLLLWVDRHDLDPQFVAQDAGVGEERLLAPKGVQIRTAHANLPDADKGLARSRCCRFLQMEETQLTRLVEIDCFHTMLTFLPKKAMRLGRPSTAPGVLRSVSQQLTRLLNGEQRLKFPDLAV